MAPQGAKGDDRMRGKRHSPEQIIVLLRQAEVDLGSGSPIGQVCQKLAISEQTFDRWRTQYGGMKADEMKRLRELQAENERLKKIVANQALDIQMLKEVARGNF
jgi:transposase-like protein